jgi:putative heme-binding domain-containing protein
MQNAKGKMQKVRIRGQMQGSMKLRTIRALFAFCILNLAFPAALLSAFCILNSELHAQHETAFDIEDGGRAFRNSCANCHGPDGNEIPGIDLGRGQFRRPMTDEDLVRIIRNGIPNTPMPPTNMAQEQAVRIVAYLRSVAASKRAVSVTGDVARGKALFDGQGACTSCHRVNGIGSRVGPDLSGVGQQRRAAEIEQSLVDPSAEVLPTNRFYRVVSKDGSMTTGRLLNLDTFSVQMMDTKEQLRSFVKADLREHGFVTTPMPSFKDKLTQQEMADVVSYLASLKTRGSR